MDSGTNTSSSCTNSGKDKHVYYDYTVSIPAGALEAVDRSLFAYYLEMFAYDLYFSSEKLYRDVPEFQPTASLEQQMAGVLEAMDRTRMIPDSDAMHWEDALIEAQRAVSRTSI